MFHHRIVSSKHKQSKQRQNELLNEFYNDFLDIRILRNELKKN